MKKISGKDIIPVLKTDAYGLGIDRIAKCLDDVAFFAVNDVYEAYELYKVRPDAKILILSKIPVNDYYMLSKMLTNVIISITSIEDIEMLNQYSYLPKIKVHIYIDTGMNRYGIKTILEYNKALEMMSSSKYIIDGIYTHVSSSDALQTVIRQMDAFLQVYKPSLVHVCASNTYLSKFNNFDVSRVGLDIICDGTKEYLKQVITVSSKATEIRKVFKGESVGYFNGFSATKDEYIAILPIGYSNGFDRKLTGYEVYSEGSYYPIIGNVCMNHMFIKVDKNFSIKQDVELISKNNPIIKMANYLETIPGEIITRLKLNKKYIW